MIITSSTYTTNTNFTTGSLVKNDIVGLYKNQVGAILTDSKRPLLVALNENSDSIRTVDLNTNKVISVRDIFVSEKSHSIDINQVDGSILVTDPLKNRVMLYPQSQIGSVVEFKTFNRYGSLSHPLDAKSDYCSNRIWIADTYNHRVLKINSLTSRIDLSVSAIYPYSMCPNLNNSGVFIRGYNNYGLTRELISYYDKNGNFITSFEFGKEELIASSSSSSSHSSSSSYSSSYSSPFKILMPNVNTMCYDHVRSRLWWITDSKIYVADTRNYQVQTMNVAKYNFNSIKIDFSSGNAFAIGTDIHSDKYLIQIFRDNNKILGVAYVL